MAKQSEEFLIIQHYSFVALFLVCIEVHILLQPFDTIETRTMNQVIFLGNRAIHDWFIVVSIPNFTQFPRVPAASKPVIAITNVPLGTIFRFAFFFHLR